MAKSAKGLTLLCCAGEVIDIEAVNAPLARCWGGNALNEKMLQMILFCRCWFNYTNSSNIMLTNTYKGTNWIKAYIVDVLPCLTALLYALVVIYNIAFFSVFNIDVTDFLSFSEMIVSIIQPLLILSVLLLLLLALVIYFIPAFIARFNRKSRHKTLNRKRVKRLRWFVKVIHSY